MMRRYGMPGLALLVGIAGCAKPHASTAEAEPAEAHVTVRAEPAKRGTVVETVEGLGRCEALPDHLAMLNPAVEGHVHELLVKEGEPVKKGQPIVALDTRAAQADLAEKTATRDGLKAALALLKAPPRPEDRRANELAIDQAKVAVARAKRVADGLHGLSARHDVSDQQVFDADQALVQARLQQQTAEAQLQAQMIGPRPEAIAEAVAKVAMADGAVALSQAHLDYHTIRSPIDGVLDSLTCHPGQTIAIGASIGEVVDTRNVFATVWLATRPAGSVRSGQAARVRPARGGSDASAADEEGMAGKVAFLGRVADPQTGNLPVRVLVENPDGRLSLGQTVAVSVVVAEKADVLQVPAAALLDQGEGPVLNVVRDGKSVALHPETGPARAGWVAVSGVELKAGEPVIVDGGYNLPDGTPVLVAETKTEGKDDKTEGKAEPASP